MFSSPIVRFAPSPTGRIHIGNARTALLNWLYAQKLRGTFILRFDDTDLERSKAEYARSIEEDLAWLDVKPDLVRRQSERMAVYDSAFERLKAEGRLYPAYETAEELERRRKRSQALGRPPIYDRAALRLTEAERAGLEAAGRRPHWRFKLEPVTVRWDDLARGERHIDCASLSDPVLRREDGTYLYTLPSVVDDIEFGVTDVIRGEDHVTNTAVQIQLFEALGAHAPRFGHHNLLDRRRRARACPSAPARCRSDRCATTASSRSRSRRLPFWSAPRRRCARSPRSTNSRASPTSRISRMARRVSTRRNWRRCRPARCTGFPTPPSPTGSQRSGSRDPGRKHSGSRCVAISPGFPTQPRGGRSWRATSRR